mgnify:CR=1 FL=1
MFLFLSLASSQGLGSSSVQGAFGAVTIDGKIWNQVALRPIIPIGKVSVALDIVFYIDQNGNIHDDEWDFSDGKKSKNSIIDKIYYIRYGKKWDPFYFQIGALDNVTIGQGILVNRYSNTILGKVVLLLGVAFVSLRMGKLPGLLAALVMIVLIYDNVEGFDNNKDIEEEKANETDSTLENINTQESSSPVVKTIEEKQKSSTCLR